MPRRRSSFRLRSSKVETTEIASEDSNTSFCTETVSKGISERRWADLVSCVYSGHFGVLLNEREHTLRSLNAAALDMDSILEAQRQAHEETERYEIVLYSLLARNQPSHETKLQTEHKAAQVLDRLSSRLTSLKTQYEDEDARKAEVDSLAAPANPGDLSEFYSRLVKIQGHYDKYPDAAAGGFDLELAALLEEGNQDGIEDEENEEEDRAFVTFVHGSTAHRRALAIGLMFSGEEAYGKYVDLYASHTAYNNLKNIAKRVSYLQYLDVLAIQGEKLHQELPKDTFRTREYEL